MAKLEDLDTIEGIFSDGREFLKSQGLPQWQNGYGPDKETAAGDISRNEGFIFINDNSILGYAALIKGIDEFYTAIRRIKGVENTGTWDKSQTEYVSIHSMALSKNARGKGFANIFIKEIILEAVQEGFYDIRIDTHSENKIMRRVIENAGFILKGEVEFPFPNGERMAYQLLV